MPDPDFDPSRLVPVDEIPFDPSRLIAVEDPQKTVYVEGRDQVIGFPDSYDDMDMDYSLATDIDKKDKNNFFGMTQFIDPVFNTQLGSTALLDNLIKGATRFGASLPQVAGSLMKEAGETGVANRQKADAEANIADKFILDPGELAGFVSRRISEGLKIPERLQKAGQNLIDTNKRFIDEINLKPTGESGVEKTTFDIGSGVGSVGASIGLTALSKRPEMVGVLFGLLQKGSIYEEARSKGIDPQTASTTSTTAGIAEGALEFVGLHVFFNVIKTSKPIARVIVRSLEEATQEGSQQGAEEAITAISGIRKDKAEDIAKRIGYATALGFVASAPVSAIYTMSERQGVVKDLIAEGKTPEQAKKIIESVSEKQVKAGLLDETARILEKETSVLSQSDQERKANFEKLNAEITKNQGLENGKKQSTKDAVIGDKAGTVGKEANQEIIKFATDNKDTILKSYAEKYGNLISNDLMKKEFSPVGYTGEDSRPYQAEAGKLTKEYLNKIIEENKGSGKEFIITTGGTGAGKSSTIANLSKSENIVLDVNLTNVDLSSETIQHAINNGLKPTIAFVLRDPKTAYIEGVIKRSVDSSSPDYKRIISVNEHIKIHEKAKEVFNQLREKFGDNVKFKVYDNRGESGSLQELPLENFNKIGYSYGEIKQELEDYVKSNQNIPEESKPLYLRQAGDVTANASKSAGQQASERRVLGGGSQEDGNNASQEVTAANDFYERNRKIKKAKGSRLDVGKSAEEFLTPISSRLQRINPELKRALVRFESNLGQSILKDEETALPFLEGTKKMQKDDLADLDLALKNGDVNKIDEVVNKYGLQEEYKSLRALLNDIHRRALDVGIEVGYLENYHPRTIKDVQGFLDYVRQGEYWSAIQETVQKKELELGRYMTDEEKAYAINSLLRGYGLGQIRLERPANLKERDIDIVTPELNAFYDSSNSALVRYIVSVNENIESRKFFGRGGFAQPTDKLFGLDTFKFTNVDDSIGAYTLGLIAEGKITPNQEMELREILKARFNAKGTSGIFTAYKNLAYIDTMGSVTSAITQIGDLAWAGYKNGIYLTGKSFLKSVIGKSELTKTDLGIDRIAQEFADESKSGEAVRQVFKWIGLEWMDNLGKETLINSSIEALRKQAKKPSKGFMERIESVFGEESAEVIADLKSGAITENIKLLAFSELSNFQPISLSEMPQKYLSGGNGRIFYMLKSFTIKQIDIFRRESFDLIARGEVKEGLGRLVKLSAAFVLMNATADLLKALLLGRPIEPDDLVIDNLLRMMGFSKFQIYKAKTEGIGSAAVRTILPPFKAVDSLYKDIVNIAEGDVDDLNDIETVQSIPFVGKLYYWWFGKGRSKSDKKRKKKNSF